MKAITPKRTLIRCDTCHVEFPGNPHEWLHTSCPKCGAPDIITDDDMAAWRGMHKLIDAVNEACGDFPDDPSAKAVTITVWMENEAKREGAA